MEQADTTTVVYPEQSAVVDEYGNLLIAPTVPPTLLATLPAMVPTAGTETAHQPIQERRRE